MICKECTGVVPKLQGIICANFGLKRGANKRLCLNAWHGSCYKAHPKDKFPTLKTQDLEDSLIDDEQMEEEDPLRFKEGRDGDHLLTPFVCDECVFEDLQGRSPDVTKIARGRMQYDCFTKSDFRFSVVARTVDSGGKQEGR